MADPVYFNDFRASSLTKYSDDTGPGFRAWNETTAQPITFTSIDTIAHQGYTADTASAFHYVCDDFTVTTGRLARYDDNSGGVWTLDVEITNVITLINADLGISTIDHIGDIVYYDDGGNGIIYVPFANEPEFSDNGLALFTATTLAFISATILQPDATTFDFNGVGYHDNELYVSSFGRKGVQVYDRVSMNLLRSINFDPKVPYPDMVQGVSVDATGIHLHTAQAGYYLYDLDGKFISSFRRNTNSLEAKGPEGIEVRNGTIRILYDGGVGEAKVRYYPLPVTTEGTIDEDGLTMGGDGTANSGNTVLVNDSNEPGGTMPNNFTCFMEVRANSFATTNYAYGYTRTNGNHFAFFDTGGKFNYTPRTGGGAGTIQSDTTFDTTSFNTICFRYERGTGGQSGLMNAALFVNGVSEGTPLTGFTTTFAGQILPYGFGGIGETNTGGRMTFERIMIFNETRTDQQIEDFEWPSESSPELMSQLPNRTFTLNTEIIPIDTSDAFTSVKSGSYTPIDLIPGLSMSTSGIISGAPRAGGIIDVGIEAEGLTGTKVSTGFIFYERL